VITGVGPWTAIGCGFEPFWTAVLNGTVGARTVEPRVPSGERRFRSRIGAPAPEPTIEQLALRERDAALLDPTTRTGLAATALALADAGIATLPIDGAHGALRLDGLDPQRVGVLIGTGIGGLSTIETAHRRWIEGQSYHGTYRFSLPMLIPNAVPAQIAIRYGLRGECKAVATACAAGTMAIGDAYRLIRDGELDAAVAGGVDWTLSTPGSWGLWGFDLLGTLSTRNGEPQRAARPFDLERDGFVLADGAGIVVLESREHARARGGRARARVAGYATTCEGHSILQISPSGDEMVRCMTGALRSACLSPADIGYVNAHGTATRQTDAREAAAIRRALGPATDDAWVNSTKAMTGHAIGGSGGIEAIVTALSVEAGVAHRCVNLERPDPECDVPLPLGNAELHRPAALSNSFGFGGHNATLVLTPP